MNSFTRSQASGLLPSLAFAVWDGSNVERNGMKDISTWFTAQMPETC